MNRIGIVGGGQLGRMLTEAAQPLGFKVIVLDPTPNSPAGQVADEQLVGDFKDAEAIRKLAGLVDFLTFEIESANAEVLNELLASGMKINPRPVTLSMIKDKFQQKSFFKSHGLPVADFKIIESPEQILGAAEEFGYPMVLKARFDAYDGRGNALINSEEDIPQALAKLGDRKLYVEKFVPFVKELAVVAARGENGETVTYPVVETIHKNHICHTVIAPANVDGTIQAQAEKLAEEVMRYLEGAGVFGIEMFLSNDGQVLINEIAPRVHNSGHFTIEGCNTSQFEQHIRAITGMPLIKPQMKFGSAVMVNILGDRTADALPKGIKKAEQIPGVTVHIYGKSQTKPERKMGHLTVVAETLEQALVKAGMARNLISI